MGRVVTRTSPDWYRVTLAPGAQVTASAVFSHAAGDIDVFAVSSDGSTIIDTSQSVSDSESVTLRNNGAQVATFFVQVFLYEFTSTDCNTYTITLTADTGACIEDGFEQNDSFSAARPLPFAAGVAVPGDEDWYSFEVAHQATRTVSFSSTGNVQIELWDESGNLVASGASNDGVLTQIPANSAADGWHTFSARILSPNVCSPYQFSAACNDDAQEPNDTFGDALPIAPGPNKWVSPASPDFFTVTVPPGQVTEILLTDVVGGRVALNVYDLNGDRFGSVTGIDGAGSLAVTNEGNANAIEFVVEISAETTGCVQYHLDANLVCVDSSEPGSGWDFLADLPGPGVYSGSARTSDQDWYRLVVPAGDTMSVMLSGSGNLRVFDDQGIERPPPLTNTGLADIEYRVAVDSTTTLCQPYTLQVLSNAVCPIDSAEPNDTEAMGANVQFQPGLTASDPDFYTFSVPAASSRTVQATFEHRQSDLDLEVRFAGTAVGVSGTIEDAESFVVTNTSSLARTHTAQVYRYGGDAGCNVYSFGVAPCADDALAPNASPRTAEPLQTYTNLVQTGTADDWFVATLNPGETLTVDSTFSNGGGNLDLELRDERGRILAAGTTNTSNESVQYRNDIFEPRTVYLRSFRRNGGPNCNTYSLAVSRN